MEHPGISGTILNCLKQYWTNIERMISDETKFTDLIKTSSEWLRHTIDSEKQVRAVLYKYCETYKKRTKWVFSVTLLLRPVPKVPNPGISMDYSKYTNRPTVFRPTNCPSTLSHLSHRSPLTNIQLLIRPHLQKRSFNMIRTYSCPL